MQKESRSFKKPIAPWVIILAAAVASATGVVFLYSFSRFNAQSPTPISSESTPAIIAITALGRLEPQDEVTRLSAPNSNAGAQVQRLLVKEGDKIKAGQVVALLENHASRLATLEQANNQVQIAQARLAQVKAGAKTGEIAAQKATITRLEAESYGDIAAQKAEITRLEAESRNAKAEYRRYRQLYQEGAISSSNFDSKRLSVDTIQSQINEAKATLNRMVKAGLEQTREAKATLERIAEIRPVDLQLAQAEVTSATTAVKEAQADLDLTYVRSPIDGQVLKVHTKSGEIIGNEGIVELGKTKQMYVVAEIYETDIGKVSPGQVAIITSTVFTEKLRGIVTHISLQVEKQNNFNVNPGADTDRKIVEAKIRIVDPADSQRVSGLTNLQVEVTIPITNETSQLPKRGEMAEP